MTLLAPSRAPRSPLIPFFVLLGSCGIADPDIDARGVVRFSNANGGTWAIDVGEDRLAPINLPAEFRVDGLEVRLEAKDRRDLALPHVIGRLVELEYIQVAA